MLSPASVSAADLCRARFAVNPLGGCSFWQRNTLEVEKVIFSAESSEAFFLKTKKCVFPQKNYFYLYE